MTTSSPSPQPSRGYDSITLLTDNPGYANLEAGLNQRNQGCGVWNAMTSCGIGDVEGYKRAHRSLHIIIILQHQASLTATNQPLFLSTNNLPTPSQWRLSRTPRTTSARPSRAVEPKRPRKPTRASPRTATSASAPAPAPPRMPSSTRRTRLPTTPRLMCTRKLLSTRG